MSILSKYESTPHNYIPGAKRYVVPISPDCSHYLSVVEHRGTYEIALLNPNGFVRHPLISSENDEVALLGEVEEVESTIVALRKEFGCINLHA